MNNLYSMPLAGDQASILPYILIGAAVVIVAVAIVFSILARKKK